MFWQYCLNVSNLYAYGILADIKVLVTTEGFMSKVRSWYVPSRQLSGRLKVAGTDRDNSLIFIRSKNLPYLVMTDQSASSTDSVLTLPSSPLSRFWQEQYKTFQSQPTHPSTGKVLSRGESTLHTSALVQCTLKMALKQESYYMVNVTSSARNQAESSI